MKGLLLKDFYIIRGNGKQTGLGVLCMLVWCIFLKNSTFFSMMVLMYSAMLVLTSMSYDEASHFDKYELTLPVTRKEVVRAKYVLLLLLLGAGLLFGLAGNGLMRLWVQKPENSVVEDMISIGVVACFFLISFSIMLPVVFRLGVEKARLLTAVIYMAVFAILAGTVMISRDSGMLFTEELVLSALGVAAAVAGIAVIVSYYISLRVIRQKEW